jgi:hypothetical protein
MRLCISIFLFALVFSGCNFASHSEVNKDKPRSAVLTVDEKHRLYTAALVATGSQYDTKLFKDVCRKIGIMNDDDVPNDRYIKFVSEDNVEWSKTPEAEQFKQEINTREKAWDYIEKHLGN